MLQDLLRYKKHHSFHTLLDLTCQQNYFRLFQFTILNSNLSEKADLEIVEKLKITTVAMK